MVGATVTCSAQTGPPGERNLEGNIESILLEAARQRDEGQIEHPPLPDLDAVASPPAPGPSPFDRLRDDAMNAMMAKDYRAALSLFEQAQALVADDRLVNANIERLRALTTGDSK